MADATRNHGAVMLERLADATPYLIGGSADLAGSNAPPILKGRGTIGDTSGGADFYAGTNIHFGVREHAMAAITNGIALDGTLRSYCGTFLIFSDYLRPSLRLAALMGIPSLFVFTHDSIYLGEDGPTHQPIEHLDALRAIPNVHVFRPADGPETAAVYAWIARHTTGPVAPRALAPEAARARALARASRRGRRARRLRGARSRKPPGRAGGERVGGLARLRCGREAARGERRRARGVAALSRALLRAAGELAQRADPDGGGPVVAIEAARGQSLRGLVGTRGFVYGLDRFGASAPYTDLAEFFGFTPDRVCARVLEHLRPPGEGARSPSE